MLEENKIVKTIRKQARELGFLDCRVISACKLIDQEVFFRSWLNNGMHGGMEHLEKNVEKRLDPTLLVEKVKSIIVVQQNYYNCTTPYYKDAPILSKYAYGADYHDVIRNKLHQLLHFIDENVVPCSGRVFVDSAPVMERAWAVRAGLGWIGKNCCLISRKYGSFFFLGEIFLDADIQYVAEEQVPDHCGTCTRCIDSCPTQAIVAPRVLDARKCIAYQTIESKEGPDNALRGKFKNRVFGCDICQDVCPWNSRSISNSEPAFRPDHALMHFKREEWSSMDQQQFDHFFNHSAVKRIGFEKLKRNLEFLYVRD